MSHSFPGDPNFERLLNEWLWLGGSSESARPANGVWALPGGGRSPAASGEDRSGKAERLFLG